MYKFLSLICLALLVGCTNEADSQRALENLGFTDIRFTGYDAFACSEDDTYHTGFTAKNIKGGTVSGTVCCGIMKSCTVRF